MKTSFCIPLTIRHIHHLKPLFESISQYTEKPDEIVISASEVVNEQQTNNLEKFIYDAQNALNINIFLERTEHKKTAGYNRNRCIENAHNDLLIFSDADDLCHPKRIELIKHVFKNNDIVHLTHDYASSRDDTFSKWDYVDNKCDLKRYDLDYVLKHNLYAPGPYAVHEGAVSFLKSKIGNVRYKTNVADYVIYEDQDFNIEVLKSCNLNFHIDSKIYWYRIGNNFQGI